MRVRVRFRRNVLGHRAGETGWVEATAKVENLIKVGALTWLDAPALGIEEEGDPAVDLIESAVDDGWYLDESEPASEDEVVLPTGETISIDELMDRLAFEDDGGRIDPDG